MAGVKGHTIVDMILELYAEMVSRYNYRQLAREKLIFIMQQITTIIIYKNIIQTVYVFRMTC